MSEKNTVVFLFCINPASAIPWLESGYKVYIVDVQHPVSYDTEGITEEGNLYKVHADLTIPWVPPFDKDSIVFVGAYPPCDHLAVSGARWFKGKGLRLLSKSIAMFSTASEFCEWSGAPYFIENPVSNISSHWRKPDYYFNPYDYTDFCLDDNYTKKTCLWVGGGFNMPPVSRDNSLPKPDDRIHKAPPGPERHNIRSATPMGFSIAVHKSNKPTEG